VLLSQMTDQIGRVLGGRYRLVAPIGTGSSAQVFLADDVRLKRQVAVKVLHPALAGDQTFLRRFRAEAQASAKLNHANIVKLLDSGNDDGPYLVTELVGGGSLRAMLDLGHRLTIAQAVSVGLEAAKRHDFAHRQGFVHRDIKPANLLFSEDGRLRIADFGVARALAEAARTEPSGAVLGTARYASPEQAQGQAVTGKGDIYSLALVLIEAVTGQVPFAADTTIGTLMARVDAHLDLDDDELGPLAEVLEWAGDPDPDERPGADELGVALIDVSGELDTPDPLPLAGAFPSDHRVPFVDPDPTHLPASAGGVIVLPDDEPVSTVPRAAAFSGLAAKARQALESRRNGVEPEPDPATESAAADEIVDEAAPEARADSAAAADGADAPVQVEEDHGPGSRILTAPAATRGFTRRERTGEVALADQPEGGHERRRPPRWLLAVGGIAVVMVLLAGGLAVRELLRPQHEVPRLEGIDVAELSALVEGNDWTVERLQTRQDGTTEGQIVAQDPDAGEQLREGRTLQVTVSRGPELVAVPDNLDGLTQGEAAAALEAVGLRPGEISEKWGELVPAGIVLGESLVYDEVPEGSLVPLVASKGPRPRTVPDAIAGAGLTFDQAASLLADVQLQAVQGEDYSDTVPEGQVIGTSPGGGAEVPRDSEVVVIVSQGPEPVIIPDISGDSVADAQAALEAAGLVVDGVDGPPNGIVTGTDPDAGLQVDRGTSIVLLTQRRAAAG